MPLVPTPKNCDPSVKKAIQILTQKLGLKSVPNFASITLTDLTASSLIGTNASKLLESVTIGLGLDYTRPTLKLSHLGIQDLTDPGADRILFWDDSATACAWLGVGNSIAITTTTVDTIQDIRTTATPTFDDLTISTPVNIYALSHDSFADFVANKHIDHTTITLTAGSGIAGGGTIAANRTFDLDINSLTVATIAAGDFVPFWDITATATNKKITFANFETTLNHDSLTGFVSGEHFLQTAITNVSTALATGLLKVTTSTGALSVITDSSANWNTAYTHSQLVAGNPHVVTPTELSLVIGTDVQAFGAALDDLSTLTPPASDGQFIVATGVGAFAYESGATARTSIGLGSVENTALSTWAGTANITTLGTIATVGNITIADGGIIRCAGAPVIEFDDTNNYLEITGCKVGIGTAIPGAKLEIKGISGTYPTVLIAHSAHSTEGEFLRIGRTDSTLRYHSLKAYHRDIATNNYLSFFVHDGGGDPFIGQVEVMRLKGDGKVGIGVNPVTILTVEGTLTLKEQASADADTAAYGQIWCKTATPNELWFTSDDGVDHQIAYV